MSRLQAPRRRCALWKAGHRLLDRRAAFALAPGWPLKDKRRARAAIAINWLRRSAVGQTLPSDGRSANNRSGSERKSVSRVMCFRGALIRAIVTQAGL